MTRRPIIADYMTTDLLTLPPETEINRATSILLQKGYSGAPVVNSAMKLVGVLPKKIVCGPPSTPATTRSGVVRWPIT